MEQVDITIIGAGVIGLALAERLSTRYQVVLLEKNEKFGQETSSRNSEVIHAGIYYPKGSLKAELCVRGKALLYEFCHQHQIPHRNCGKLIIAQDQDETAQLATLEQKALANGVTDLTWLNQEQVKQLEPEVRCAAALLSPSTGILDSHALMRTLLAKAEAQGVLYAPGHEVVAIERAQKGGSNGTAAGWTVVVQSGEIMRFHSRWVINSAGLHAQHVSEHLLNPAHQQIPPVFYVKGLYFMLKGANPFKRLIYPVPQKHTVGVGIHVTLDMAGQARFGPDTEYVQRIDYTVEEHKKTKFFQAIRRYFPAIQETDLMPGYAGIRPKLQSPQDSAKDFVIQTPDNGGVEGMIHLFGIESPGLTACLALAEKVETWLREHD